MKDKKFVKHIGFRGRLYILRLTVAVQKYGLSKTGFWPLGGKAYRYQEPYNTTRAGAFFHAGPFAQVGIDLEW